MEQFALRHMHSFIHGMELRSKVAKNHHTDLLHISQYKLKNYKYYVLETCITDTHARTHTQTHTILP